MDNNTTIITERYEYFENHINDLIEYNWWTTKAKNIIRDAYLVDINPSWVEAQLRENRHSEIYIRIIQKCRLMQSSTTHNKNANNTVLAKQLDNICLHYRNELLTELTNTIREYCL